MQARELYKKGYEAQIHESSAKVDELKTRVASLETQARLDMQPRVDGVNVRLSAANAKLEDVATAPDDKWDDVRSGADRAWRDLKAAVESAHDALKANVAKPLDWAHIKEALRRDWEQTRHDFGLRWAEDLNQNLGNTIAQAVRVDPIPARHVANEPDSWSDEAAIRFGYGWAMSDTYRLQNEWNGSLEACLEPEWHTLTTGRPWADVRLPVRYGWMRAKAAARGSRSPS